MIQILIADDHAIVRQGLKLILENNPDLEVVADFTNGADARDWLEINNCDVALLDIAMPGISGIDLLKHLRNVKPELPVLILSSYPEDQYAVRLIKDGAAGYLNKECAPEEVVNAVKRVLEGNRYISPSVAEMFVNELCKPNRKLPHEILSNREYQIFILFATAKTAVEIAMDLQLSAKTVSTYRKRILEKMLLNNNAELMRYAVDKHLLQ